jgi:poly(3-hydroxybutyrate) depolymerase
MPGSGGIAATGGAPGSGGTAATGGILGSGGIVATGGIPGSGGIVATGGIPGSGGIVATGGVPGSGGIVATGGVPGSGGIVATGGVPGSGGTVGSGGILGTGGATPSGGAGGGTSADAGPFDPNPSAGCGTTSSISQYNNGIPISIDVSGVIRRYILRVPTDYNNNTPYRLIVAFHALDGNDKQMDDLGYYDLLSRSQNTTIFVAPNGQKNGLPCSGTASGESGCGWPNTSGSDMALTDAVVAQIEENFCVDRNRIFATGWSYGASMSYEVGCQRPFAGTSATWGVRGIAIYSGGQLSGRCQPDGNYPVAFYASHGTNDSVICYDLNASNGCVKANGMGGVELCQTFAVADGCTWQTPTKVTTGDHVCTKMAGCKAGFPVEFCSFSGSHTPFPDSGVRPNSWGPAEVWKFINQF